jgi:hypothetical protein
MGSTGSGQGAPLVSTCGDGDGVPRASTPVASRPPATQCQCQRRLRRTWLLCTQGLVEVRSSKVRSGSTWSNTNYSKARSTVRQAC